MDLQGRQILCVIVAKRPSDKRRAVTCIARPISIRQPCWYLCAQDLPA